jgi:hypothetical protein
MYKRTLEISTFKNQKTFIKVATVLLYALITNNWVTYCYTNDGHDYFF